MKLGAKALLIGLLASCGGGGGKGPGTGTISTTPQRSPSEVAKACAMAVSCVSPTLAQTAGQCAHQLERMAASGADPALQGFADCTKTAADCTAALSCASLGHGPDYCASHPGVSCDGDLVIDCFPSTKPPWAVTIPPIDCRDWGMTCLNSMCSNGKTCDDIVVLQCLGGGKVIRGCDQLTKMEYRTDCGLIYPNGVCDVSTLVPLCAPPKGGLCSSPVSSPLPTCQGNILSTCQQLLDIKLDCAKFDSHCGDDRGVSDCIPNASDCTRESPDRCNGAMLEFCQDGHYQTFGCSSVGLGPCAPRSSGGVACGSS